MIKTWNTSNAITQGMHDILKSVVNLHYFYKQKLLNYWLEVFQEYLGNSMVAEDEEEYAVSEIAATEKDDDLAF